MDKAPEKVRKILKENNLLVISTASPSGKTEAATMLYAEDNRGGIYFYTFKDSRKYPNLKQNPRASIVIHNGNDYLQMDGHVTELKDKKSSEARRYLEKKNGKSEYMEDPRSRYFLFKPSWIRIRVRWEYPPEYVTVNTSLISRKT